MGARAKLIGVMKDKTIKDMIETYNKKCKLLGVIPLDIGFDESDYVTVFKADKNSTNIVIPDFVESIWDGAFRDCTYIETLELPKGLKSISRYAFFGCKSLKEIVIPDSVESIGESAFLYTALHKVTIPKQCLVRSKAFNNSIIVHRKSE